MKRSVSIYLIFIMCVLYLGISLSVIFLDLDNVEFAPIDLISVLSLVVFVGLCVVGLLNEKNYLVFLVFIIIAFPTAVNNFIPGIYWGDRYELGSSIFPLITHLDIYLLLGILRFRKNSIDANYSRLAFLVFGITLLMFASFVVNIFDSADMYEAQLMVMGSYQFRHLILIFFILLLLKDKSLFLISIGLSMGILLLLAESSVYTILNRLPRLSSGSLATNTFGNIVAQISLFLVFFSGRYKPLSLIRIYLIFVALVGLMMALLSETRMSVLAALLVYVTIWVYRRITLSQVVKVVAAAIILLITVLQFNLHNALPEKFKVWNFIDQKTVVTIMNEEGAMTTRVLRTPESSSIITRLQLYRTSLKMIKKDPVFGVGAGRWNYFKPRFGFDIPVLIDSHNGYLALLSQFGLLSGLSLILFLLIGPSIIFLQHIRKQKKIALSGIWLLGIISLGMTVSEFSNAGIFKPQVYGLLTFIAMILISEHKKTQDAPANR